MCVGLSICMCICVWRYHWRPKQDIRSPRTGVTGSCKLPTVGAMSQTQVLCKSNVIVSMKISPFMLRYLNSWCPIGGAASGGFEAFATWSVTGGDISLEGEC